MNAFSASAVGNLVDPDHINVTGSGHSDNNIVLIIGH